MASLTTCPEKPLEEVGQIVGLLLEEVAAAHAEVQMVWSLDKARKDSPTQPRLRMLRRRALDEVTSA
jgi:hypothetical protein